MNTMNNITLSTPDAYIDNRLIDSFIADQDISKASKSCYEQILKQFFDYLNRNQTVRPMRSDVIAYKEDLIKDHSARTVTLHLSVLRRFFEWTFLNGLYPNIACGLKGIRSSSLPKKQALTSEQVAQILRSIDTKDLSGKQKYALVLLASTTGLRCAEISNLNVEDLQVVQNQTVLMVKGKGHQDKDQLVRIGLQTDQALREALSCRKTFYLEDPLFISTSNYSCGQRISSKGIGKILKKILNDNHYTGKRYTAHSFRHTACCLGLEATDKDLIEIQKFMRHASVETTMIYSNHEELLHNDVSQIIENMLIPS